MSLLNRQITYLKYTLSPSFARPLNGILAGIIVLLVFMLYFTRNTRGPNEVIDFDMGDYSNQGVPRTVDWSKYVKMWEPVELTKFDMKLTRREKCPACYGEDLCDSIEKGLLQVDMKGTPEKLQKKGIYFGRFARNDVVIKTMVDEATFKFFDEAMCKNITGDTNCDIAKAIVDPKSFAAKETILKPSSLTDVHKMANRKPPSIHSMHCASEALVSNLASVFDSDNDGVLKSKELAYFYTSYALNQEAALFRGARSKMLFGFETAQEAFHGSKFYGACGRVMVLKYGGVPVSDLLDAPWEVRVDLALNLLGMVGQLEASDLRWYFIYGDFQLQNFVINTDGFLGIVDAKDISLVDLDQHPPPFPDDDKPEEQPANKICNADCFKEFAAQISDPSLPADKRPCKLISLKAGQIMTSHVCKMLSDFDEHKYEGRRFRGMLHSPPKGEVDDLKRALSECVTETSAGGRDGAVNDLYSILDYYLTDAQKSDNSMEQANDDDNNEETGK